MILKFAKPIQFYSWEYTQIVKVIHNVLLPHCWLSPVPNHTSTQSVKVLLGLPYAGRIREQMS